MSYAFPKALADAVVRRWTTFVARPDPHPELPLVKHLRQILDTAFFASLEREEGRPLFFNLCCSPSRSIRRDGMDTEVPLLPLENERDFTVAELRRLAPAAARQNAAIFVRFDATGASAPRIAGLLHLGNDYHRARSGAGFFHRGPPYALTIEVRGPGAVHVYQGRFRLAYIEQGQLVTPDAASLFDFLDFYPLLRAGEEALMRRIREPKRENPKSWAEFQWMALFSTIFAIVNGIGQRGHGGTLAVLDPGSGTPHQLRMKYGASPPSDILAEAFVNFMNVRHQFGDALEEVEDLPADGGVRSAAERLEGLARSAELALGDAVQFVAQLASVDGALVMTSALEVVGFGAEIIVDAHDSQQVQEVRGFGAQQRHRTLDSQSFGMRHRSSIRFVAEQPTAVMFVISQDGGVTFVSSKDGAVLVRRNVNIVNPNMPGA
jgi:hypothetical protein